MRKLFTSVNPYTKAVLAEYPYLQDSQLLQLIANSDAAYLKHSSRSLQERGQLINNLVQHIQKREEEIAATITSEMGKPLAQARAEVKKSASFCKYYSTAFDQLKPTEVKSDAKKKTLIKYKPQGALYQIIPFNYPFYLFFKGGLPNLLLGNVILSRPAQTCPKTGLLAQQIFRQAGFQNQFQTTLASPDQLDLIMQQRIVCGVSFTGSSRAGGIIAQTAGKNLKTSVMQLGGNDPFIVLQDANVKQAVKDAIRGRCSNAGQICFSPKRYIVHQKVYDQFKSLLIGQLKAIKAGDPTQPETQMGPLARPDLHLNLTKLIAEMPKSWKIVFARQDMKEPFYPITLIQADQKAPYDHELFGPVFTLYKVRDDQHAIAIANSSAYGLGGSVYSQSRGEQVIDQVRVGMGFVNEVPKSDVMFPSGGVGRSGFGRECGVEGFRAFANIKVHYEN